MIVGVDLSTFRIDLAWLDAQGRPQRWHQELGTTKEDAIDRMRRIAIRWPSSTTLDGTVIASDVTEVCIEWPWGRGKALPPLMAVTGIVTRQAPSWARVSWAKCGDLRRAIGAKDTKADVVRALSDIAATDVARWLHVLQWNEHELDALVTCVGWTRILERQETAR